MSLLPVLLTNHDVSMPVDNLSITLKPVSFFKVNPSMDVPGTRDAMSASANSGQNGSCH